MLVCPTLKYGGVTPPQPEDNVSTSEIFAYVLAARESDIHSRIIIRRLNLLNPPFWWSVNQRIDIHSPFEYLLFVGEKSAFSPTPRALIYTWPSPWVAAGGGFPYRVPARFYGRRVVRARFQKGI